MPLAYRRDALHCTSDEEEGGVFCLVADPIVGHAFKGPRVVGGHIPQQQVQTVRSVGGDSAAQGKGLSLSLSLSYSNAFQSRAAAP